ncbi:uncharacterized protein BO66DRAFT_73144 [Aspergillus aculeatinus CBS 121060]|uniref:Uncharacterized protein n=1 Tax=Aspergillus aculeatinus CBS 121060 TaxID=1448322 RepID=A0ACD1HBP4_9EURO|nr:hypothetical protein BO66DRAFT_73144 [Aspergillus aculeatinus CBS 121060]RAH70837.1 hypothetical protein BO66DRAFT_73144 [Aspergillus aculeatinus CBS 121060]
MNGPPLEHETAIRFAFVAANLMTGVSVSVFLQPTFFSLAFFGGGLGDGKPGQITWSRLSPLTLIPSKNCGRLMS